MSKYYADALLKNNEDIPRRTKQFVTDIIKGTQHFVEEECDRKALEELNYIESHIFQFVKEGCNLYIGSKETGNGKTSRAIYLAYKYTCVNDGKYLFVSVPHLFYLSKQSISDPFAKEKFNELIEKIKTYDLVIWDDIATKSPSQYETDLIYILVNGRDKANIFTSNVLSEQTMSVMDNRIADRITDGTTVDLNANSFRGRSLRSLNRERGIE